MTSMFFIYFQQLNSSKIAVTIPTVTNESICSTTSSLFDLFQEFEVNEEKQLMRLVK